MGDVLGGTLAGGTLEGVAKKKREIGMRLTVLNRMFRSNFDRLVSEINVTRSQWTMILAVGRNPGATQRGIAEALEMSEASAGRLIDRLCGDGLLERHDRDDDRRARAVHLSPSTEPLIAQLSTMAAEAERRTFQGFSEEELDTLQGFIDRLYENAARF